MSKMQGPIVNMAGEMKPEYLVVFLHGYGADGNDLIDLSLHFNAVLPNAIYVSPHAPYESEISQSGRQWFSLRSYEFNSMLAGAQSAYPVLNQYIDHLLMTYGLTEDRLIYIGFSQGTMMSLFTSLRREKPAAAVIGFSGHFLHRPELDAELKSKPPIILIHGEQDEVVPADYARKSYQVLKDLGVPVEISLESHLSHSISQDGLQRALEFLENHVQSIKNAQLAI